MVAIANPTKVKCWACLCDKGKTNTQATVQANGESIFLCNPCNAFKPRVTRLRLRKKAEPLVAAFTAMNEEDKHKTYAACKNLFKGELLSTLPTHVTHSRVNFFQL